MCEVAGALDRAKGALVGLALGDALGTTLEFSGRDTEPPVTDLVGGGPFRLAAGEWTDDTSMALCLADSLLERGLLDVDDVMERFLRWYEEGHNSVTGECFDIGATTAGALHSFRDTGEPLSGGTDPQSAGNGSAHAAIAGGDPLVARPVQGDGGRPVAEPHHARRRRKR